MNIIVVSEHHKMPLLLLYHLGTHLLVITHDYESPHAFELVAPKVKGGAEPDDAEAGPTTVIFDEEETYNLYQCLHTLFQPSSGGSE